MADKMADKIQGGGQDTRRTWRTRYKVDKMADKIQGGQDTRRTRWTRYKVAPPLAREVVNSFGHAGA
jgi:hypothetical protein